MIIKKAWCVGAVWNAEGAGGAGAGGGAGGSGNGAAGGAGSGAGGSGGAAGAGAGAGVGAGAGAAGGVNPFAQPGAVAGGQPGAGAPAGGDGKPASGQPYYPKEMPEHLRGGNDAETIDKLFANASGLRQELSKRGSVPEKADGYKLDLSPELQKAFGDPSKDKATQVFRALAHKHKMPAEMAQAFYADWHETILSEGLVKPIDYKAEARKVVGPEANGLSERDILIKAEAKWNEHNAWFDRLVTAKSLSPEQAMLGRALLETATGMQFVEGLQKLAKVDALQPGGTSPATLTKDDLDRMNNDPRANPHDQRYDPTFAKRVDDAFKQFYSTKAA